MLWKPLYSVLLYLLLSSLLLSFNCSAEIGIDEFISDGAAKIRGSSPLEAKYEALERAKKNAFMQAVCTIISTKQFVDNYSEFKETISEGTGKYISSFSILIEEQEEDLFFIKILGKVNLSLLRAKLSKISQKPKDERKEGIPAKIMVVIPETHIHVERRRIPDPAAETEIIRHFLNCGLRVVDQAQVASIRETEQIKQSLAGNDAIATAIGLDFGADIVVIGEAFSEYQQDISRNLRSCSARVEARAIRTDTGEIVTAHGIHSSGVDSTEQLAAKKALASAGRELAEYFAEKFQSVRIDSIAVQINISPVDYKQFRDISKALEGIPEVVGIRNSSLSYGIAKIDIRFRGSMDDLGNAISALSFDDFKPVIVGFSASKIEVTIEEK